MKKVLIVFFICIVLILGIYLVSNNESATNMIENFFIKDLEEYNNEYEVNRLRIKNQVFYFNLLNEKEKNIYTAIASAIKNLDESVKVKGYDFINNETSLKDVEVAMTAFFADHPEVFYVDNQYSIVATKILFKDVLQINLKYLVNGKNDLEAKIVEIEAAISEYSTVIKSNDPFEIELSLHDKVASDIEYYNYVDISDVPQDCHNIYGALINKKAVCDGFTKTVQILLDRNNIESLCVLGALETQAHAWNLVKLGDAWYHLDLTSNKSVKESRNDKPIIMHAYFNITTEKIHKTHTIEHEQDLPAATLDKYNYYIYTGNYISNTENFNNKLTKLLKNNKNAHFYEFEALNRAKIAEQIVDSISKNRNEEYITNNKILYYNVLDAYAIMKKE